MSTEYKLKWLQAMACTRAMPRSVLAVAMLLATKYLNGTTGEAWPSLRTLADDLHVQRGHVSAAVDRMEKAGFLRVVSGGPRKSNHYKIKIPRRLLASESDEVMSPCRGIQEEQNTAELWLPQGTLSGSLEGPSAAPSEEPEHENEPENEPETQQRRRQEKGSVVGQKRRSGPSKPKSSAHRGRARTFPVDFDCARLEFAAALKTAGWDRERAAAEFVKFRSWHSDRGTRSQDWSHSWRSWCTKGESIDSRERSRVGKPRVDRAKAGVLGVMSWYQEQTAAAYDVAEAEGDT